MNLKTLLIISFISQISFNLFASGTHFEKDEADSIHSRLHKKRAQGNYGRSANPKKAISLSEVVSNPQKYLQKEVTISGEITDVCPKAGCWLRLKGAAMGRSLRVKVKDGDIVFPLSSIGRKVVARGKLTEIQFTAEDALEYFAHIAEEKGEEFDRDTAIKILANLAGPLKIYQLNSYGAVIK